MPYPADGLFGPPPRTKGRGRRHVTVGVDTGRVVDPAHVTPVLCAVLPAAVTAGVGLVVGEHLWLGGDVRAVVASALAVLVAVWVAWWRAPRARATLAVTVLAPVVVLVPATTPLALTVVAVAARR